MIHELEDDVYPFLKDAVLTTLESPHLREWTVQGFGMMRTYFGPDKTWRLNIYHPDLAVPNVSTVHNHPWSFHSWIMAGTLTNRQFHWTKHKPVHMAPDYERMHGARIMTGIKSNVGGPGKGGVAPQFEAWVIEHATRSMQAGEHYFMDSTAVHETQYTPFCVSLNRRVIAPGDTGEHADVFWPHDTKWVSAKPRLARTRETRFLTRGALAVMRGHQ